jgi:hypothetical protein
MIPVLFIPRVKYFPDSFNCSLNYSEFVTCIKLFWLGFCKDFLGTVQPSLLEKQTPYAVANSWSFLGRFI